MPKNIFFNEGAINLSQPVAIIRAAQKSNEFRIVCSSSRRQPALQRLSDHFEIEPRNLGDAEYIDWCLGMVRHHGIDVLWPGRRAGALADARKRFEEIGTRVLCLADSKTLAMLSDKASTYENLASLPFNIPDHAVASDAEGFMRALDRLQVHPRLCFKPTVSIYGIGFRILTTSPSWKSWRRPSSRFIDPQTAMHEFGSLENFAELIVMEYLPGPERSVDCLAWHGELIRCVIRRKPNVAGLSQIVERHEEIEESIRCLSQSLGLTGLFNVQFRDARDRPYLLEINPRMSGGIRFSCQAGVALPYWLLRLEDGGATPEDIPFPQIGTRVGGREAATSC